MKEKLFMEENIIIEDIIPGEPVKTEVILEYLDYLKNLGMIFSEKSIKKLLLMSKENLLNINDTIENYRSKYLRSGKPMYCGFPDEVRRMHPEEYYINQFCHYLSVYGVEFLSGLKVKEGWMPETSDIKRIEPEQLADLSVIEILSKEEFENKIEKDLASNFRINEVKLSIYSDYLIENKEFFKTIVLGNKIYFKEVRVYLKNLYLLFVSDDKPDGLFESPNEILTFIDKYQKDVSIKDNIECYMTGSDNKKNSLSISEKRFFLRELERFDRISLSRGMYEIGKRKSAGILRRLNFYGMKRYIKTYDLFTELKTNYNINMSVEAKLQRANNIDEYLKVLSDNPGILLRKIISIYVKFSDTLGIDKINSKIEKFFKSQKSSVNLRIVLDLMNYLKRDLTKKEIKEGRAITMLSSEDKEKISLFLTKMLSYFLESKKTSIFGKKVYLDMDRYNLELSSIPMMDGSFDKKDLSTLKENLALRIDDSNMDLRFYVFWNDPKNRVDIDLHSYLRDSNGEDHHIGWDGYYLLKNAVHSGDITTSNNSMEYIDLDIDELKRSGIKSVVNQVHSFYGGTFKNIPECFFGIQAIPKAKHFLSRNLSGENVDFKLFSEKNILFNGSLESEQESVSFDYLVEEAVLLRRSEKHAPRNLSLKEMLDLLTLSQKLEIVDDPKECDIVLSIDNTSIEAKSNVLLNDFIIQEIL